MLTSDAFLKIKLYIWLSKNFTLAEHTSCDSEAFHSCYRLKMHCRHAKIITVTLSMVSLSAWDALQDQWHSLN